MTAPTPQPPNRLSQIFFSPAEARLRTAWRLLGQFVLFLIFGLAALLLVYPLLPENGLYPLSEQIVRTLAVVIPVYLARRFLDRRSFASLGLKWERRAVWDLLAGFLIGGVSTGLLFAIFWGLGWLRVEGFAWQSMPLAPILGGLALALVVHLLVGFSEELLVRGYWLQNLEEGLNLPWAVLITGVLFSLSHLGNPGYGWPAFFGLFVGSLDLAYGYVRTRRLWLPIGLHLGWNFFEGAVFGFQVSGGEEAVRLVEQVVKGPGLWTGGAFGPEAGALMVWAVGVNVGLIWWYTKSR